jgi:hypothetical protein
MTENSDKNTYNSETRIDELLNSLIDGELTPGQQTEVESLIADDVRIARRLRQLQQCKTLLGSLPRSEAPPSVLEGVKASLAQATLHTSPSISDVGSPKSYPRVRRVLAAAAMIGLVVVLTTVMRPLVTSQTPPEQPVASDTTEGTTSGIHTVILREFSGRLALKTSDLVAVSASINKAIEGIDLSEAISPSRRQERRIYTLSCSKEDLKLLLSELESVWPALDSATLAVNTEVFGEQVIVKTVTPEQVERIVEQDNPVKRIEMAKDFAALNTMALLMPGQAVATAIEGQNDYSIHEWRVPKPALAKPEEPVRKTPSQSEDKEKVHLTIVVSW